MENLVEILVRYGELGLKSSPVRKFMENILAKNIKTNLIKHGVTNPRVLIRRSWGRLIVSVDSQNLTEKASAELTEKIVSILSGTVFGITSVSPVIRTSSSLNDLFATTVAFTKNRLPPYSTFAVRARRVGKHSYTSIELEQKVGEKILEALKDRLQLSVNLSNPDYTLSIEVRDDSAFIFDRKIQGFGGLPQGTQGRVASILRGSVADAVAGFLLCKRGVISIPVAFKLSSEEENGGNTREIEKQLEVYKAFHPKKKHVYSEVHFSPILEAIGYDRLQCSTCDKVCLAIVEKIVEEKNIAGITLGNAPGTLSDRTPKTSTINNSLPIYYPLIALHQEEINHPFKSHKDGFCLSTCPGFSNEKKKEVMPPSQEELAVIVAKAVSSNITSKDF